MPVLECIVRLEIEGVPVEGFPIRRTVQNGKALTVDELQAFNPIARAKDGFRSLPVEEIDELQVLAVQPDKNVTLRLDGQTSKGIPIRTHGLVFIFGAGFCQPSNRNALIRNDDPTDPAHVQGIGAGGPKTHA